MITITDPKQFVASVKAAMLAVEQKSSAPILRTVLLRADNGILSVTGNDLENMVASNLSASVKHESLAACVEPKSLLLALDAKGGAVSMTMDGNALVVHQGGRVTRLATLSAEDFPVVAFDGATSCYNMPENTLCTALGRVSYAISREKTRFYLNGVCFDTEDGTLKLVATDGHHLGAHDTGLVASGNIKSAILRSEAVKTLEKLLGKSDDSVIIERNAGQFRFTFGNVTVQSRAVDGTFPDWRRVVPKQDHDVVIHTNSSALGDAIAPYAKIKGGLSFVIEIGEGGALLYRVSIDGQVSKGALPGEATKGAVGYRMGVNPRYLANIVARCEGATTIYCRDEGPWRIESEDTNTVHAVMPMRVPRHD